MAKKSSSRELSARRRVIKTRVNDAEFNFIAAKASLRRVPISTYLRLAAMQRREHQSSALLREIQKLNADLLDLAIEQGQVLNFAWVAEKLAELMQRAEVGDLA
ncbi:hypothetical protein JHC42_00010 [Pseudomonas sp. OA3]|nr:hypothetical protein [Pseudomonas sp. OA3]